MHPCGYEEPGNRVCCCCRAQCPWEGMVPHITTCFHYMYPGQDQNSNWQVSFLPNKHCFSPSEFKNHNWKINKSNHWRPSGVTYDPDNKTDRAPEGLPFKDIPDVYHLTFPGLSLFFQSFKRLYSPLCLPSLILLSCCSCWWGSTSYLE